MDRKHILEQVHRAEQTGANLGQCAKLLGLSVRTIKRWRQSPEGSDARPSATRLTPPNALSEEERKQILEVCNRPENASKPPGQIVPELADQGIYLASESSFYRVLKANKQQNHRGRARAPKKRPKATHSATAPNRVWVWDITFLQSRVSGIYYKLYFIMDLFSRKIIAYEVWPEENAENSKALLKRAALSEQIAASNSPLVLHGDNGSPLKAGTVLAMMQQLGITPSHSRPRVSNDNPHAEALFRTAKYHPSLPPKGFETLEQARQWALSFVTWYNHEHRHSALKFVSPATKHSGADLGLLAKRAELYEKAKRRNPDRWICGNTRDWTPTTRTSLNPTDPRSTEKLHKKAA